MSVVPGDRYPAEGVALDRHPADRRERQVSGHHRLAGRGQLPQHTDPHADRLLGIVVESVLPVGVVEVVRQHGVAVRKGHPGSDKRPRHRFIGQGGAPLPGPVT
jgi:hypothetical protein